MAHVTRLGRSEVLRAAIDRIASYEGRLPADAGDLTKRLRASIRLRATGRADATALGSSRLGGLPDVPEGFAWPKWEGAKRPDFVLPNGGRMEQSVPPTTLAFIAQINLAELPDDESSPLPRQGFLYFFYDAVNQPWGFDPTDRGSTRVLFHDGAAASLQPATPPDDLEEEVQFSPSAVVAEWSATLPTALDTAEPYDSPRARAYQELCIELGCHEDDDRTPIHRMLGHPQAVQNDSMDLEVQLVSHGLYCGDATGYNDPRAKALEAGAADWVLLLQVDTDEDGTGWMWGDVGRIYFWIRKQDLAARRFDTVWTILQCG